MSDSSERLQDYRDRIDSLDRRLVSLLDERFWLTREIAELKASLGIEIHDPERENEIFDKVLDCRVAHVRPSDLEAIFAQIIAHSRAAGVKVREQPSAGVQRR